MFKSRSQRAQLIPQVLEFDEVKRNLPQILLFLTRVMHQNGLFLPHSDFVCFASLYQDRGYRERALNTLDAGRYGFHHRSAALASSFRRADL